MAKDVLFKTMTFGGFNKEDVLEYIRAQQTQLTDTQKKLKETEESAASAIKRKVFVHALYYIYAALVYSMK